MKPIYQLDLLRIASARTHLLIASVITFSAVIAWNIWFLNNPNSTDMLFLGTTIVLGMPTPSRRTKMEATMEVTAQLISDEYIHKLTSQYID